MDGFSHPLKYQWPMFKIHDYHQAWHLVQSSPWMGHPCTELCQFRVSKIVIVGRPTLLFVQWRCFMFFSIGITSRLMSHPCRWCSSCLIPQVPGVRRAQLDSTDMNALKNGHSVPFNQLLGSPGKLGCAHILTAPAKNWGGRIIRMRRRLPNPLVKLSD